MTTETAAVPPAWDERIAELLTENNRLREDRDALIDGLGFERKQVIELRQVLTEMLTCAATGDAALFDDEQLTEWRQRGVKAAA